MIVGPAPERPEELPVGLGDRQIVDARMAVMHEAIVTEFPVLVAV